jgi:Na+/H+ antiporter NhaD/arsenite permease-like protein
MTVVYNIVASLIFIMMSFCFMFPVNRLFPLDRRSVSLFSATLCYLTRNFLFDERKMNLVEAVDFDVLVLLAAIMIVNFIMIHQKETKWLIVELQKLIKKNPRKGFWATSFAAFIISPFLTNDGVCLLFVEPILNAFAELPAEDDATIAAQLDELKNERRPLSDTETNTSLLESNAKNAKPMNLERFDAFYYLISLSCSANIGSALCYTGNPQVRSYSCSSSSLSSSSSHLFSFS